MAQQIELTTATVKYAAGHPRQTQYGDRINVLVTLADGTEQRLWGNPDDATLTALKRGQAVQLAKDTKGYKLVTQVDTPQQTNGSRKGWSGWTVEEKKALAAKIDNHADLLGYCLKSAKEKLGDYCETSEDVRSLAITLYLSALKH